MTSGGEIETYLFSLHLLVSCTLQEEVFVIDITQAVDLVFTEFEPKCRFIVYPNILAVDYSVSFIPSRTLPNAPIPNPTPTPNIKYHRIKTSRTS